MRHEEYRQEGEERGHGQQHQTDEVVVLSLVVGCTHHQRREETTQSASSSNHTGHRTNVLRISRTSHPAEDRAVAQTQKSSHQDENSTIHVLSIRLERGNNCQDHHTTQGDEGDNLRTELISQHTTEGTSNHSSNRKASRTHTSVVSVEVVDVAQVSRQVVRECHERTEHNSVEEAQLPSGLHLECLNNLRHQRGDLTADGCRRILQEEERDSSGYSTDNSNQNVSLEVTNTLHQAGGSECRNCSTHHAGTEHTGRKTLLGSVIPCGTEGNTHSEHGTRNTQEERHNKQHGQRVHLTSNTNQEDQGCANRQNSGEHNTTTVAVSQTTDGNTADSADKNRHSHQNTGHTSVQVHLLGVQLGQRANNGPCPETNGRDEGSQQNVTELTIL